ncbi:hypothetical protein SK128_020251 [Halocaridina rubra]|uniref:Uncharacterized protein n=1 Tax=Halocaridina rubra TaxID=373956 RepID=A0AAN8X7U9_HALRR
MAAPMCSSHAKVDEEEEEEEDEVLESNHTLTTSVAVDLPIRSSCTLQLFKTLYKPFLSLMTRSLRLEFPYILFVPDNYWQMPQISIGLVDLGGFSWSSSSNSLHGKTQIVKLSSLEEEIKKTMLVIQKQRIFTNQSFQMEKQILDDD